MGNDQGVNAIRVRGAVPRAARINREGAGEGPGSRTDFAGRIDFCRGNKWQPANLAVNVKDDEKRAGREIEVEGQEHYSAE
jgi:hypothetical protein